MVDIVPLSLPSVILRETFACVMAHGPKVLWLKLGMVERFHFTFVPSVLFS